jgi:hypothetical protein
MMDEDKFEIWELNKLMYVVTAIAVVVVLLDLFQWRP